MPEIIKAVPDVTLVIAGDGTLKNELRHEAVTLGIKEHVLFLGSRLDIPQLLKLFDIYVLPSLWEGLPMVLLEAMAAGCPIVATKVGGNAQVIKDGYNGMLIEPRNPQKIAEAVVTLLTRIDLRDNYINNAFQVFSHRFSADIMTKKYENIYLRQE